MRTRCTEAQGGGASGTAAGGRGPAAPRGHLALEEGAAPRGAGRGGGRAPAAARGREPGGLGARLVGHPAGSGSGAAQARPRRGAPPPGASRASRSRSPSAGNGPHGRAGARGSGGHRFCRPGRTVAELHVRGARRRQRLPVGRVVPQEPGKGGRTSARRRARRARGASRSSAAPLPTARVGIADQSAHFDLTTPDLGELENPRFSSPGRQCRPLLGLGGTRLRF